ncbi:MAG TPA: SLC13 family permease [Alphaproteobacteria bacterium]|nr:SLC13 family permease [Alphaproteobacteria bacterium]
MTLPQIEALSILVIMLGLFASDRLRYDLVGGLALTAAALTGIVPPDRVFSGFSNSVIIIIASVLVLSRAIELSGVIEAVIRRILGSTTSTSVQVGVLTTAVAGLSAFMKNVGTLGIFMPIAIQIAERSRRPPSRYLMPLAFGSLVGGTMTLIGTGPNLIISTVRQELTGRPFTLFDFSPVGVPLTVVGVLFLSVAWRLIPRTRRRPGRDNRILIETFTSELIVPENSWLVGKTVHELEEASGGEATATSIVRKDGHRYIANARTHLVPGEIISVQIDPAALQALLDRTGIKLHEPDSLKNTPAAEDRVETVEAIISTDSPLVGQSPQSLRLRRRYEIAVLAVKRGGKAIRTRIQETTFEAGDIVVIQGRQKMLDETLTSLGCVPLLGHGRILRGRRRSLLPIGILLLVMIAVSFRLVATDVAFFAAAVLVVLLNLITPKQAYEAIDWPVIIMLGSLIPVGEALKLTGVSSLIADGLTHVAMHLPDTLALGLVVVVSMAVTPFLHHAAAVLVMGPVAFTLAHNLGYQPDPFFMAVALGASSDFLSPIGHQNNALVMGPGGYRFGDYWPLGLPLSIIVATLGTLLIRMAWPLH